jgi:diguanylate cyclase (GGDEF)-like protein
LPVTGAESSYRARLHVVSDFCMTLRLFLVLASTAWAMLGLVASNSACAAVIDRWSTHGDRVFQPAPIPTTMQVTAMVQDDDGFIWLGTQTGLARWDGYRLVNHMADPDTPGSLGDSYVNALLKDSKGRLWVGTSAGGLAWRDRGTGRFNTVPVGPDGTSHVSVFAIVEDGAGGLWVGTGAGVDHLDVRGTTPRRYPDSWPNAAHQAAAVTALRVDRGGNLWVGTRRGLFRYSGTSTRFEPIILSAGSQPQPSVTNVLQDIRGDLWITTRDHGAFVWRRDESRPAPVREPGTPLAAGLASDTVFAITEVDDDTIWLGTFGGGIVQVDARDGSITRIRHHDRRPGGLPSDDVWAFMRDHSGLIWVATDSGLSSHDRNQHAISTWFGMQSRHSKVTQTNVSCVLAMPDDTVWLGLGDGGVDIVEPRRGRVAQLLPDAAHPRDALPKGRVLAMRASPAGDIYIGTQQGLYLTRMGGKSLRRIDVQGRDPASATWAIHLVRDELWLGGLDGLWGFALRDNQPPRLLVHETASSLGDQRITAIANAPDDALWIGTRDGLLRYDTRHHTLRRIRTDAPGAVGAPGGYISSVLTDQRGRLWIGSFGRGVRILDNPGTDDTTARRVTTKEGLPHNAVNAMVADAHGAMWISTDDGVARISPDNLSVAALHGADGLGISTYWTNSAAVTKAGELLFGGVGGLTIIQPDELQARIFKPPVVVTNWQGGMLSDPQGTNKSIELEPEHRDLLVEFAALDYSNPELNRYAYRLSGYEQAWVPTDSTRRAARYTNLPPGDYVLELRGSNRQGQWSEPLRQPVRVLAAWHETGWFRTASATLTLGLLILLMQARTLVLKRRERVLEHLVSQRTAELERRSAELLESERRLEQMAYFDGLTGVANRRLFNEDLRRLVALAHRGQSFSLLLIDLDRFKYINDTLGHDAGDALLAAVASRLSEAVREVDRVARLGGDEFAVLLSQTHTPEGVETVCRRIVESVARPVEHRGELMTTSASIGAARCPLDAETAEALCHAADQALYAAKRAGRNTWRCSGDDDTQS